MKSFRLLATSLLLCSGADMVVTKTYTSWTTSRTEDDGKDFDAKDSVRFQTNCGVVSTDPVAIYIRPFSIDSATFRGDEAASVGEMPIRKSLTPIQFAADLKEKLSKLAPARLLKEDEEPRVGWLVEGNFDVVDGGDPAARFFFGHFGAGRSFLLLHVKVTGVLRTAWSLNSTGPATAVGRANPRRSRANGHGKANPFDLRKAAERIMPVLGRGSVRYRRALLSRAALTRPPLVSR